MRFKERRKGEKNLSFPAGVRGQGQAPSSGQRSWDVLLPASLAACVLFFSAHLPSGKSEASGYTSWSSREAMWVLLCAVFVYTYVHIYGQAGEDIRVLTSGRAIPSEE